MKKKLISLCMTLALVIALIPAALADGGIELQDTWSDSRTSDTWSWDHTTRTFTLNGGNYTDMDIVIYSEKDITVVLKDGTTSVLNGLGFSGGQVTIRGNGTLTTLGYIGGWGADITILNGATIYSKGITGNNVTLTGGKLVTEDSIDCNSKFLMTGGELNVTAKGDSSLLASLPSGAIANLSWIKASQLEITGGTVSLTAPNGYGGSLSGSNGGTGQSLILRNCTLTWTDGGDGNLAMFDKVTIDNAKVQWSNRGSNSRSASIYAGNPPTITNVKAESYKVNGPVELYDGSKRYYIDFANGGLIPNGASVPQEKPVAPVTPSVTAAPTNDALTSNGAVQNPTVYKIGGNNYFKIRDLAAILNGTSKQFSVGYDSALKSVTATTGEGYTKLDTDLTGAPAGGAKAAQASNDAIYINGEKINAEVYKIDGSNYFKLRDLGKALDFYVGWSKEQGVFIETDKPYSE